MKYFILVVLFFTPLYSLEIVEGEGVAEILAIQNSLVAPLEAEKQPEFGFITIARSAEYLQKCEKRILAYVEGQVAGYMLLESVEGYLQWAKGRKFDGDLSKLGRSYYIDQIGVSSAFARQGIGTALVEYAKKVSPDGLLADILWEPNRNEASITFLKKQGFSLLGVMEVEATDRLAEHKIAIFLWTPY